MAKRTLNPRLVKIHRTYAVDEIATVFDIHKNTVRRWLRNGLTAIDSKRPILIHGAQLAAFLSAKRQKNRQRCAPGQIYCVRCRSPQEPAGTMAEYRGQSDTLGMLIGICPRCNGLMYRRVNIKMLEAVKGKLEVTEAVVE